MATDLGNMRCADAEGVESSAWPAEPGAIERCDDEPMETAQFAIPALPPRLVDRSEVLDCFDLGAALTVVQALPGYGKSTAVARLAHRQLARDWRVAWLDLDSTDRPAIDGVRSMVERSDAPVLLVLDNLGRTGDDALVDEIVSLLEEWPGLRVVVCTSSTHPITVKALHRSVDVKVVRGGQLAIARHRLVEFAEAWGHHLDPARAEALHELTAGWPMVTRLILADSAPQYDPFAFDLAREFLTGVVAPHVMGSERVRLAARLAVPEVLTEGFVRALLSPVLTSGEATPLEIVEELESSGALERVTDGGWERRWRFAPVIRRGLLAILESRLAGDLVECHRIVAEMHLESGERALYGRAMVHARAAKAWDVLARLWVANGPLPGLDFSAETVNAFVDIPHSVLDHSPVLAQASAVLSLFARGDDPDPRDLLHATTVGAGPALADLGALSSANEAAVMGAAAMVLLRSEGRLDQAAAFGNRLVVEIESRRRRGDVVNSVSEMWLLLQRGVTELHSGRLENALTMAAKAFHSRPRNVIDPIAARAAGYLSMVHAVRGAVEDSRRWQDLHRSGSGSESWLDRLIGIPGRIARAVLALEQLDRETVDSELGGFGGEIPEVATWAFITHAAVRRSLLFGHPRRRLIQLDHLQHRHALELSQQGIAAQIFSRARADLLLSVNELNRAARYMGQVGPESAWLQSPLARLHLIAGNNTEARRVASAGGWNSQIAFRDRLELFAIDAVAALRAGDVKDAAESFAHAHGLGSKLGMLEFRATMPRDEHLQLMNLIGAGLDPEESARLERVRIVYPGRADLVVLTPREHAVLKQMKSHDSVQAVAEALTVSVNTVKKQRVSIYAKLGVHERSDALSRAYRLGLLDDDAPSSGS